MEHKLVRISSQGNTNNNFKYNMSQWDSNNKMLISKAFQVLVKNIFKRLC